MLWVSLALLAAPFVVMAAFHRAAQARRAAAASTIEVASTAKGLQRTLADGRAEAIRWAQVTEVEVLLVTKGPHAATGGVVVFYGDATTGCLVPVDRLADAGVFSHLHRLPGFDEPSFRSALAAAPPAQVVVWRSPEAGDTPSGSASAGSAAERRADRGQRRRR